jgi:hypothetical protein
MTREGITGDTRIDKDEVVLVALLVVDGKAQ